MTVTSRLLTSIALFFFGWMPVKGKHVPKAVRIIVAGLDERRVFWRGRVT